MSTLSKSINAVLGLAVAAVGALGLWQALVKSPALAVAVEARAPEVVFFAGFLLTGAGWFVLAIRPSRVGNWLLYASALGTIWLNSLAHLATRDSKGFASASSNDWLGVAAGALGLAALLVLAARTFRQDRAAARSE